MPASLPFVHTLVAMKSDLVRPDLAAIWPIKPSAVPYIGEESITLPPRLTKSVMTSVMSFTFGDLKGTSNVTALPSPIIGSFSPVDGMARIRGDPSAAKMRDDPIGRHTLTVVAPINFTARRRVII